MALLWSLLKIIKKKKETCGLMPISLYTMNATNDWMREHLNFA